MALIRALLRREEDPQVRSVGKALVALAESRGAPLPPEGDGTYRSTAQDDEPQIVFQPSWTDPVAGIAVGALWVQLPGEHLVPLAQRVEVVAGVVPAFLSPERSAIVYEAAVHFGCRPRMTPVPIGHLQHADLTAASTLFVGPARESVPDMALLARLQALGVQYG